MTSLNPKEPILYRERVHPNIGTFLSISVLLPAITLVSEPFDFRIGIVFGSLAVIGIWAALYLGAPVIEVRASTFRAGSAVIPRKHLGKLSEIYKDKIFFERGPGLDPASYKVIQGTVQKAIKVLIKDDKDPTPYWIVSTRKPSQLAAVLNAKI